MRRASADHGGKSAGRLQQEPAWRDDYGREYVGDQTPELSGGAPPSFAGASY